MFRTLKLYFTNRPYYEQWKRYKKLQKTMRKKLVQQAKEFCPWSGAYLHDMVKTMLEFYYETYKASHSWHTGMPSCYTDLCRYIPL
jgi:hypothetical protein